MRRALELARTPGVPLGPNPLVGCVLLDPDGATVAEGRHRGAGSPHAEVHALARGRGPGPRRHRRRHPRALQPHRPHRAVRPGAGRRRRGPGGLRAGRPHPGRGRRCGDAPRRRRRRRGRPAGRRGPRRQPRLVVRRRGRPPVRHLEARHHARRPQRRRRRHLALDQLAARPPRRPPAAGGVRRDHGRHRHGAASTTRSSTVRDEDDENLPRERQLLRVVMGTRDVPATRRVLDDAAETRACWPPATRGEALAALYARDRAARCSSRAARPSRPPSSAPGRRRGRRLRRPDAARRGPHAVGDAGIGTIADALHLDVVDVPRLAAAPRPTCGSP